MLDEVGELSLGAQAKLLRVLDCGTYRRVGASTEEKANARIVAATNRNLAQLAEQEGFRTDLYYPLVGLEIYLPPLRERIEEIPILVETFLEKRLPLRWHRIAPQPMAELLAAPWPGNVRELESVIERTVLHCTGDVIGRFELLRSGPPLPFRLATWVLVLAELEEIAITTILPEWRANVSPIPRARRLLRPTPGIPTRRVSHGGPACPQASQSSAPVDSRYRGTCSTRSRKRSVISELRPGGAPARSLLPLPCTLPAQ